MAMLRVLLADGEGSFRVSAQRTLTRQGYFIVPAASGTDALACLERNHIDVVVAQVELPGRDYLEVLRAARARTPPLPVILLASPRTVGLAASGVREGAFDYLVKPLDDFTRLALLIDRAVQGAPAPPAAEGVIAPAAPPGVIENAYKEFGSVAASGANLETLLAGFIAQVAQLAHAAQAMVLLAQGDGQLHLAASHGFVDRAEAGRAYVQLVSENLAWRIAAARTWLWDSTGTDDIDSSAQEGPALLGLPLRYADQVLGIVVACPAVPRDSLDPASLEAIALLTQQAALATELARAHSRVEQFDPADAVTGLFKREHFLELADREFRRSWRYAQPIAAVHLDIDDFSRLHLMLGPDGADQVLRQVAACCRPRVRTVDLMGRLEADTLGLLLVMVTREQALAVAERLRRLVAEVDLTTPEGPWQVTASVGVAAYPRANCASVQDLFAFAEQAARAAKRAGRNRVIGV